MQNPPETVVALAGQGCLLLALTGDGRVHSRIKTERPCWNRRVRQSRRLR